MKKIFSVRQISQQTSPATVLTLLSFLSGTCGISYEILYARLLNTYLGDMFYVAGAILSVFLLGIAAGSFASGRVARFLWLIEGFIGLYAILLATLVSFFKDIIVRDITPVATHGPAAVVGIVTIFLLIPSLLVGTAVPLFSRYLDAVREQKEDGFGDVYFFYNAGAALFIFIVEFLFLRAVGTQATLYGIACINFIIAATLKSGNFTVPALSAAPVQALKRRPLFLIGMLSVASGIYQLLFLKFTALLFGPYNENFTLTVAIALLMIPVSIFCIRKFSLSFDKWLTLGSLIVPLGFLLTGPCFCLWGYLADPPAHSPVPRLLSLTGDGVIDVTITGILLVTVGLLWLAAYSVWRRLTLRHMALRLLLGLIFCIAGLGLFCLIVPVFPQGFGVFPIGARGLGKIFIMLLMGGPLLFIFCGTIPALLQETDNAPAAAGRILAVASIGNCAGYLLMILLLDRIFSYHGLAILIAALVFLCALTSGVKDRKRGFGLALSLALIASLIVWWPGKIIKMGALALASSEKLHSALAYYQGVQEYQKFGHNISILKHNDNTTVLVIDGYWSLNVQDNDLGNLAEVTVGTEPAFFAPSRDDALVLGAGTGITSSAAAQLFKNVDVVEINPIIVDDILSFYARQNGNLLTQPNVHLTLQDGMVYLANAGKAYDAIINTVTTPLFFSSSKLYTSDFFQIVKRRLKPGGVYSMWFDSRVGTEGVHTIFRTLQQNFKSCHFAFLSTQYLDVLCSDGPLTVHIPDDSTWPPAFRNRLWVVVKSMNPSVFFNALLFPADVIFNKEWPARTNTFNLRALEYSMSHAEQSALEGSVGNVFHWTSEVVAIRDSEAADKCLALHILGDPSCAQAWRAWKGHYSRAYLDRAAMQAPYDPRWAQEISAMADDFTHDRDSKSAIALIANFRTAQTNWLNMPSHRPLYKALAEKEASLYKQSGKTAPPDLEHALALLRADPAAALPLPPTPPTTDIFRFIRNE